MIRSIKMFSTNSTALYQKALSMPRHFTRLASINFVADKQLELLNYSPQHRPLHNFVKLKNVLSNYFRNIKN